MVDDALGSLIAALKGGTLLHLRPRTLVALLALACSLGVAGSALSEASAVRASTSSSRYNLRLGDQIAIPAIGWSCDLSLAHGSVSFSCSPGKSGTNSQGAPLVLAQWNRLVIFGGRLPKMDAFALQKGGPFRIWTYPVVR